MAGRFQHHEHCNAFHPQNERCNDALRDARANLPTGPQKVVQLPGTTAAPAFDAERDLHKLAESAAEAQAKADAHNDSMRAAMAQQQEMIVRATIAAERQATAAERQAEALEHVAQVLGAACMKATEVMTQIAALAVHDFERKHGTPPTATDAAPTTERPK